MANVLCLLERNYTTFLTSIEMTGQLYKSGLAIAI